MRTGFWFLSCPVLGKQVEYVVMSWMVQVAESRQAGTIEVPFVKGRDNQVLYAFLAQLAAPSETPATLAPRTQTSFHLPVTSLTRPQPGDLLGILQSGAYGLTASPINFLSHPTPAEVLVDEEDGELITPRGGGFQEVSRKSGTDHKKNLAAQYQYAAHHD
jgi:hypothetical protein